MRRSPVLLCEHARIGAVNFAEDEVVALPIVKIVSRETMEREEYGMSKGGR